MQLQALQCTVDTAGPLETARRPPARSVRVEEPSGSLGTRGTGRAATGTGATKRYSLETPD